MKKNIVKMEGIVLNCKEYRDNSALVKIITPDGLKTYIAKGVYKANSHMHKYVYPFTKINFNATESTLGVITEVEIDNNYIKLKNNITCINYASILSEKILILSNQINVYNYLYDFFVLCLDMLSNDYNPLGVVSIFEIKLLYLLGIKPILNICPLCKNQNNNGRFSVDNGGILCERCCGSNVTNLTVNDSIQFKKLYLTKPNMIDSELINGYDYNNIQKVIDEYYFKYLEFISKSKLIIKKINLNYEEVK